jgi:high-affinity iron transporter
MLVSSDAYRRRGHLPCFASFGAVIRAALVFLGAAFALTFAVAPALADSETWTDVANDMAEVLGNADETYRGGDATAAKELVNDAYYGYYEKAGFERTVMAYISGERGTEVEYQFTTIKKMMLDGTDPAQVSESLTALSQMLLADAGVLDGTTEDNPWKDFLGSITIILREGLEALLVVAAIVAYLSKAGHADKNRYVYGGVGLALVASVGLAWVFSNFSALAGANQEVFEGVTILIAVAMLVWVSNWIFSKADAASWSKYIKGQSDTAISGGSLWSLTFVAFLAVFREGAETIIFYQALFASGSSDGGQIWLGLGIGLVVLVAVYLVIRLAGLRIPVRPFFMVTSVLLAALAVSFAGSGVKELQEADLIPATAIPGFPTVDLLGLYPRVENLCAQGVTLALIVVLAVVATRRARAKNANGVQTTTETN